MNIDEIWVVCVQKNENEFIHVKQILTKASDLGQKNEMSVSVVCIGKFIESELWELHQYGASKIVLCEMGSELSVAEFSDVLEKMIDHYKPRMIMYPSSVFGKAIAAYMSIQFESGLTADCIDINVCENGNFIYSRAALNSSVIAKIVCVNSEIEMCTVKKNVFQEKKISKSREVNVEKFDHKEINVSKSSSIEIISKEINNEKVASVGINNAKLIFAFGRGAVEENTMSLLKRNAEKYNASIVGTRAVVEEQLLEKKLQVGQSGISIAPDVCVSLGISGATQHIVGIKNSQIIIAVNNDPNATIFEYSDYAVVDDVGVILNELMKME